MSVIGHTTSGYNEAEDMENIGRALMETISNNARGYSWAQCPTEIVTDLINERDELRAVVKAVVDWNTKYPSSRIYGESQIREIAKEMDAIFEQAKELLPDEQSNGVQS